MPGIRKGERKHWRDRSLNGQALEIALYFSTYVSRSRAKGVFMFAERASKNSRDCLFECYLCSNVPFLLLVVIIAISSSSSSSARALSGPGASPLSITGWGLIVPRHSLFKNQNVFFYKQQHLGDSQLFTLSLLWSIHCKAGHYSD